MDPVHGVDNSALQQVLAHLDDVAGPHRDQQIAGLKDRIQIVLDPAEAVKIGSFRSSPGDFAPEVVGGDPDGVLLPCRVDIRENDLVGGG